MTRARAALLLLLLPTMWVPSSTVAGWADAMQVVPARVVLFVVDRVSFEELMAVPQIRALARSGGAALMTTKTRELRANERDGKEPSLASLTIGFGTRDVPSFGRVPLLNRVLVQGGIDVCYLNNDTPFDAGAAPTGARVLALRPTPGGIRSCSRRLVGSDREMVVVDDGRTDRFDQGAGCEAGREGQVTHVRHASVLMEGRLLERVLHQIGDAQSLVLVVSPSPSCQMEGVGDEVTGLVWAKGRPDRLLRSSGATHTLRSGTTRQTGLVSNVDVAPTILDFFGVPIPSEMDGQPIRVTNDPAPFRLHRLHLEQRRIRFPLQLGEVAFVSGAGAVAIGALLLAARRRLPPRLTGPLRFMALCGASLPTPLMLGGVLPRLTYWVVVPFVVLSVVALGALARAARWPAPLGPFTFLGLVGMAVLIVDATLGWRGARIPLIGGTMFDGARFYGLPNAFVSLLLASALFVAAALPPFPGFLVLIGAGLFAGFPSLGADIGGAVTAFFAAGLWWVLRTRRHFGIKELAFVAGMTALGLGAVLVANRYLPGSPTHATRFVERTGGNLGDAFHEFGDRLSVGFEQVRKAPAALIPLLGLPVVLALVLMRPGPIGWGLDLAGKRWKHVLVVLTLAGVVAFFANDTGVAAAAPVFLYAMSGIAYPAFLAAGDTSRSVNSLPGRVERRIDE